VKISKRIEKKLDAAVIYGMSGSIVFYWFWVIFSL